MDVELQIIKHLARDDTPTVPFLDRYCAAYKDLFPEVRSYECFKYLHLGIIAPIKRKSLPEIFHAFQHIPHRSDAPPNLPTNIDRKINFKSLL